MQNHNAKLINEKLGVNLFDTSNTERLKLNKFSKKMIKELCIDDLINNGEPTPRLINIIKEVCFKL